VTARARVSPRRTSLLVASSLIASLCLSGCVADDEVSKAVAQFDSASTALTQEFQTFLNNANTVEANGYIDSQAFTAGTITPSGMQAVAVITPNEIKLRGSAIKALADYTSALATLASGKSAAQIQADAATASTSLKTLTTDATAKYVTVPKGGKAPDIGTPVSLAVTAMGDVLRLIEQHRGVEQVRQSIALNDAKITELYKVIEGESTMFYARQKATTEQTGVILFADYKDVSTPKLKDPTKPASITNPLVPVDKAELLQLSDRIKQYEKDSTALPSTDPTSAIKAFESAHTALVALISATSKNDKETALEKLMAEVKSFAAEVKTPTKTAATTPSSPSTTTPAK